MYKLVREHFMTEFVGGKECRAVEFAEQIVEEEGFAERNLQEEEKFVEAHQEPFTVSETSHLV